MSAFKNLPEIQQAVLEAKHDASSAIAETEEPQVFDLFDLEDIYIKKTPSTQDGAFLYVSEDDSGYWLKGGNQQFTMESRILRSSGSKYDLSLDGFIKNSPNPNGKTIIDWMKEISFNKILLELRRWLNQIRKEFKNCYLIVYDTTSVEILWEMIDLTPDDEETNYAGAVIRIARWKEIIKGDSFIFLEPQEIAAGGEITAYLNNAELPTLDEEDELKKLKAKIYLHSQISEFCDRLKCKTTPVNLAYIAAHGYYEDIAFGCSEYKVSRLDLLKESLSAILNGKGIVFMNACHTAQAQPNEIVPGTYRYDFIDLFFNKGANGVIGTVSAVGTDTAKRIGCQFLQKCQDREVPPVAEVLRQIRADAVNRWKQDNNHGALVYAFMYVYYGNPLAVLRLTPPQPGGQA
ncbi:CHAT domain-containing protein [Pseudanabaena sp. PCC 6802]|uniref:CHAT domain-containing protein n=1 Tax=Pseudanabaena sp. PCC 6802 TaxID=118173 RepID=UPI00034D211B|nr:CHAT domain-containing protein [Pseudanabaena sp. PCC 6802]